jgi:Flp pilus assembly protein TadD
MASNVAMKFLKILRHPAARIIGKILSAVAACAFLGLTQASSVQGAVPFSPACPADPPPTAAWVVLWFPRESDFAVAAGRELLARSDYPAAVCYLKLAENDRRQDPVFQSELGDALWGTGAADQAIARWEQALALDPSLEEPLDRLWKAYVQAREWTKAEDALGRWIARHGDDSEAAYTLALIRAARDPGSALDLLENLKSASPALEKKARELAAVIRSAITLRVPEYIFARTGEELLRLGEPALAEESLLRAIERNPNYGEAYALLGAAQEADGENPEDSYRRGVALAPKSALACMLYGSWLHRSGNLAEARWWLLQAWAASPGDWIVASELAQVDFALGNVGDAEGWVVQAVTAHPKEAEAWIALAAFYIENDFRVEENGIPAAREAVILSPTNDRALDILGLGWFKAGDFSTAERFLLRALEQNPDSAGAHLHLGMCLQEEGRIAEARTELESALRLDPAGAIGKQAGEILAKYRSG